MNIPTIEFNSPSETLKGISPWVNPQKTTAYQDLLLKPEFEAHRFRFPLGTTWFRIVPALRDSAKGWLLGAHVLGYPGGRHIHPRTLSLGAKSVFDHAYSWLKKHREDALYSKTNKEGYKLLADPVCLFWIIVEENGKTVARLLQASGYDGSRGGVPGLGHQIWQLTQEVDEHGKSVDNPVDPETGVQVCVDKKQTPGTRYPSYSVKAGRVRAPMSDMLAKMKPEDVALLTPLEQVVYLPSEDEEWKLLGNILDSETIDQIRNSIN